MLIEEKILNLVKTYRQKLNDQIELRMEDMNYDLNDHYLIYKILGISIQ